MPLEKNNKYELLNKKSDINSEMSDNKEKEKKLVKWVEIMRQHKSYFKKIVK